MFLFEPAQTPWDLRFRLLGIDVRVHPLFWLISAIMGWNLRDLGLQYVLLWIVCVFVSVLIHELGHILAGQLFHSHGHIVLYSFGGLAIASNNVANRWQRIFVSFAGPLAGFLFLGALYLVIFAIDPMRAGAFRAEIVLLLTDERIDREYIDYLTTTLANEAMWYSIQINLFWGLINLLPVHPLDGGQISRTLFTWWWPGRGLRISLGVSFLVAGLMAINALAAHNGKALIPYLPGGSLFVALMFGMLAIGNFMELQQTGGSTPPGSWEDRRAPWERDPDYWKR